jgi:hypothetical protein
LESVLSDGAILVFQFESEHGAPYTELFDLN